MRDIFREAAGAADQRRGGSLCAKQIFIDKRSGKIYYATKLIVYGFMSAVSVAIIIISIIIISFSIGGLAVE